MKYKILPKKKYRAKLSKEFDKGYNAGFDEGEAAGQRQVIINIQNRVRLLNQEHPVSVAELRKWFGLDD